MPGTTASRQYFTIKIVQKLICPGFCPGKREPQYLSHLLEIYYQVRALLGERSVEGMTHRENPQTSVFAGFIIPKIRDLLRKSVATMKHYLLREGINESVLFGTDGKDAGTICLRDEQKFE